jgi:excisionase family DNA binding protein
MPKTRLTDLLAYAGAFLTVGQLADYWGVSRKHILKLIETGCLESIRLGPKTYRVRVHTVIAFERRNERRRIVGVGPHGEKVPDQSTQARPEAHARLFSSTIHGPMDGSAARNAEHGTATEGAPGPLHELPMSRNASVERAGDRR